jgi:acyl transferase domain-containing protein/thioesterase domain-containing protein
MSDYVKNNELPDNSIAIIGMSGIFPGADNIEEFWNILINGEDGYTSFSDDELVAAGVDPDLIHNPNYVKMSAVLKDSSLFDAAFFGFTPREAEIMDPQHRLFLEHSWLALENAGYDPQKYDGPIGVFAGCSINNYLTKALLNSPQAKTMGDFMTMIGNEKDYLTTRTSYKLDLKGPSIDIQTACSTSLVSVHLACQSLLSYQCDMALSGGATVIVPPKTGYLYKEGIILSPDGYCRAFDSEAAGTVFGEGVGVVVLKRLEDAVNDRDYIYAIIRSSAINNDGSLKAGFTAPSVDGQAEVIAMAQALAEVHPETISYVETHGTGTPIGDPIEIAALTKAFRTGTMKKEYCAIGSVKTNIGHMDAAAGIAGLIKTSLCLKNKKIPPLLHFQKANPALKLNESPFYINTELIDWETGDNPRRAGVSSFGIGGTNSHAILEETYQLGDSGQSRIWQILTFSGKTENALSGIKTAFRDFLHMNSKINISDAAFTLKTGRREFEYRDFIICHNNKDCIEKLDENVNKNRPVKKSVVANKYVSFMFPGQGAQYINMGSSLYKQEKLFQKQIDYCSEYLKSRIDLDLREIIFPHEEKATEASDLINETYITQPALFVIEYSLAMLLINWGIKPEAMIGHSIGEYVAACISGVLSLEDALELVAVRGRLMYDAPRGSMLSVPLSENDLKDLIKNHYSLAVVNGPSRCVISGDSSEIEKIRKILTENDTRSTLLRTSHAFHSSMMDTILDSFKERISTIDLKPPGIPFVSNFTGTWITPDEATDPEYWVKHLRHTIRFSDGISLLLKKDENILLEVGPGNTLSTLSRLQQDKRKVGTILSTMPTPRQNEEDTKFLMNTLGKLWASGTAIDWKSFYKDEKRFRVPLPGYSFERKRYWVEVEKDIFRDVKKQNGYSAGTDHHEHITDQENLEEQINISYTNSLEQKVAEVWTDIFGIEDIDVNENFFELGGNSLLATQLIAYLNNTLNLNIPIRYLFFHPTISGLSNLIKSYKGEIITEDHNINSDFPYLFPIQPKGNRPPIFLVAGAHQIMYSSISEMKERYEAAVFRYFSELVSNLGMDQPVYSFLPRGLISSEKPHDSVEEMATDYIMAMKAFKHDGPYLIGGECVGGTVAYEMAQQLKAMNEDVLHLILMDTAKPTPVFAFRENMLFVLRIIRSIFNDSKNHGVTGFLKNTTEALRTGLCLILHISKKKKESDRIKFGTLNYQKTLLSYRPEYYDGDVTLIANQDWISKNNSLGWDKRLRKRLDIKVVPGDHKTRLTTYGAVSGEVIRECIDNSLKKTVS